MSILPSFLTIRTTVLLGEAGNNLALSTLILAGDDDNGIILLYIHRLILLTVLREREKRSS